MPKLSIIEWLLLQWLSKPFSPQHPNEHNSFTIGVIKHIDGSTTTKIYFHTHADFVTEAAKAALRLKKRGWLQVDKFGNHRLNDAGFQAAREIPKPEWNPPPAPTELNPPEIAVLKELAGHDGGWVSSMWVGGSNGSHHAVTLTRLVRCGYAEARKGEKILTKETIIPEPGLTKLAKGSRTG